MHWEPEPPVEVILVIDTLQIPVGLASIERTSVEAFLRRNGGHLAQPVSIFTMLDTGLWQVAQPSSDGNSLATQVAHNGEVALKRISFKKRATCESPLARCTAGAGRNCHCGKTQAGQKAAALGSDPGRVWEAG